MSRHLKLKLVGSLKPHERSQFVGVALASPPLVIAYALAGTMDFDFETQPLGTTDAGEPATEAG